MMTESNRNVATGMEFSTFFSLDILLWELIFQRSVTVYKKKLYCEKKSRSPAS